MIGVNFFNLVLVQALMKWFVDEPWVIGASFHSGAVMVIISNILPNAIAIAMSGEYFYLR